MRKHFRTLAVLLFLCTVLSSCSLIIINERREGGEEDVLTTAVGGTTATPYTAPERADPQAAADAALAALPEVDFTGSTLLIATASDASGNPLFPSGDTLGEERARLSRNAAVSERYGITFVPAAASSDEIYREVTAAHNSGLYYADLLMLPAEQVGRFTAAGLLRNLRNLPFWNNTGVAYGESADQGGAGNAVYADLGAALLDYNSLPAVFFNRTLAEGMGYDFYAAVENGEWTWELYLTAAAGVASLDGVSGHALAPTDSARYTDLIAASSGIKLVDNTAGQTPTLAVTDALDALDALLRRTEWQSAAYPVNTDNAIAPLQAFGVGDVLFCTANLSYMDWIYDSQAVWGILPLPSLDGTMHTPTGASAPVLCVTADNNKFDLTGIALSALNAASVEVITDAYITERMQNRLRDWESAAMIERIAESASYDFFTLFGSGMPSLASATTAALREAANGGTALPQLMNLRTYAANLELAKLFGVG